MVWPPQGKPGGIADLSVPDEFAAHKEGVAVVAATPYAISAGDRT
jgi:hypothetical protein